MSDNRINPASADRKNPYENLGPHDPNPAPAPTPPPVPVAPNSGLGNTGTPVAGAPSGPYPNPLAQASTQAPAQTPAQTPAPVPNPWGSPPSYPPQTAPGLPGAPHAASPVVSYTNWNQAGGGLLGAPVPRRKRRWVKPVVVGILALLLGFAMGESSAKEEMRQELDDAWAENYDLRTELDDRDAQIGALREQLAGDSDASSLPLPVDPYNLDPWADLGAGAQDTQGFPGEGIYMVGFDIEAGTYSTAGQVGCAWTRVSGDYSFEDVNGNGESATEVVIEPSDLAFMSTGCADWVRVP